MPQVASRHVLTRTFGCCVPWRRVQAEGHEHQHDSTVTSVGITLDQPLDGDRLQAWLNTLLRERGADLFRSKGVLNIKGASSRCAGGFASVCIDGTGHRRRNA